MGFGKDISHWIPLYVKPAAGFYWSPIALSLKTVFSHPSGEHMESPNAGSSSAMEQSNRIQSMHDRVSVWSSNRIRPAFHVITTGNRRFTFFSDRAHIETSPRNIVVTRSFLWTDLPFFPGYPQQERLLTGYFYTIVNEGIVPVWVELFNFYLFMIFKLFANVCKYAGFKTNRNWASVRVVWGPWYVHRGCQRHLSRAWRRVHYEQRLYQLEVYWGHCKTPSHSSEATCSRLYSIQKLIQILILSPHTAWPAPKILSTLELKRFSFSPTAYRLATAYHWPAQCGGDILQLPSNTGLTSIQFSCSGVFNSDFKICFWSSLQSRHFCTAIEIPSAVPKQNLTDLGMHAWFVEFNQVCYSPFSE